VGAVGRREREAAPAYPHPVSPVIPPSGERPRRRGTGRPRLLDVAVRADVSLGTVSNVLNHPHRVAPATRQRVLEAIDQLGFSRNSMASALARGDTRTLGLVVIDLGNSMFVDIARGAQRGARDEGYYLQLAAADNDADLLGAHMRVLNEARASGMVIAPMAGMRDDIERSRRAGCPVVVVNHDDPDHDACRVLVDNVRVGELAVRHLASLGRRHLAFVHARPELQPVACRLEGVRRAVAATGGTVRLTEVELPTLQPEDGSEAGERLARLDPAERPDAVLAVTDVLAMAVLNELVAAGLRVPEDLAVMGCDHNSATWGGTVALSSVTMEGETMGAEGVRLLLRELEQDPAEHTHTTVMLQPRVVPRESTVGRAVR
jgi:LacI family transcriptional regulator